MDAPQETPEIPEGRVEEGERLVRGHAWPFLYSVLPGLGVLVNVPPAPPPRASSARAARAAAADDPRRVVRGTRY